MVVIRTGEKGPGMPLNRCRETIEGVCASFRIASLDPRLAALSDGLSGGGVVDIDVLGQFKAGKSSFLNSLLGREMEEMGVIRTETAILVRDLKSRMRTTAGEKYHAHRGDLAERLCLDLDRQPEEWRGNIADTTRRFQAWIREALERELMELWGRGEEYLSTYMIEAQSSLHRTVRAFEDEPSTIGRLVAGAEDGWDRIRQALGEIDAAESSLVSAEGS